jgi:para-nitrobenzyl esterase
MVFFHGGSGVRGSTHNAPFDAPPLALHGVIVVTAEYRLGALGLFTHPLLASQSGSAGNYALMDQIATMRWVRDNIEAFGGDPERVMMFGESTGGSDVEALLASPLTRGLFSRAGMESPAVHLLSDLASAEAGDAPLVARVGCDGAADVLSCMRAVPASVLVGNQGGLPLGLVIEPQVLPVDPLVFLRNEGAPVPLLIGSNREEATLVDDPTLPLDANGYVAALHAEFDPLGPGVADRVLSLYPALSYDAPVYALVDVDTDDQMSCEVRDIALAVAGRHRARVWRYLFTHRFENDGSLHPLRAFHTAELYFVFGNLQNVLDNAYRPSSSELHLSQRMMEYWARFASDGDPNGSHENRWPGYNDRRERILDLDVMPHAISGYHIPQCEYLSTLSRP